MKLLRLVFQYLAWHYSKAFTDLWRVFSNFIWFLYNLFSVPFLLKTFFEPFQRLHEVRDQTTGLEGFFQAFVVNVIMRIVGALVRLVVIILGIVFLLLASLLGVCAFLLWFFLPILATAMFILGIRMIF